MKELEFLENIPITDTYWFLFEHVLDDIDLTRGIIDNLEVMLNHKKQTLERMVTLVNPKLRSYETLINRKNKTIVVLHKK